jgi:hypothetical protein
MGRPQTAEFEARLSSLIDHLLDPLEQEWLGNKQAGGIISRVKAIRMKIMPEMVRGNLSVEEKERRWDQLADLYLAQQVASYPPDYLASQLSVDRILETVERYEEDLTDTVRSNAPIKVIIEVGPAIPVGTKRDRSVQGDALMTEIAGSLQSMLDRLAEQSPVLEVTD